MRIRSFRPSQVDFVISIKVSFVNRTNKQTKNELIIIIYVNFMQHLDRDAPSFYDIFTLLNAFNAGFMVKDINEFYNPEEKNIDIK